MCSRELEKESHKDKFEEQSHFTNNVHEMATEAISDEIAEEEINMNKFFDFMKVSCHVNDVLSKQTNQQKMKLKSLIEDFQPEAPKDELNFEKMLNKELFHDILEQSFQNKVIPPKIAEINGPTTSGTKNNCSSSERRDTVGLTIGSFSRRNVNKISCEDQNETVQSKLYKKLDHVINEGMIDSVLSFICPIPIPTSFPNHLKPKHKKETVNTKQTLVENTDSNVINGNAKANESESVLDTNIAISEIVSKDMKSLKKLTIIRDKREPEIIIHVCDEVKNATRDFTCSQRLLVSKMGYFAEVTGGQKLEEMDISVHCDIQIFDWLVKWMKSTDFSESSGTRKIAIDDAEDMPQLDATNVIPILVSAGFLQMEPLMIDCLSFCHARLCDVVRCSLNLSCLNDTIITRLAAMFTNLELEMVRDKKERLVPRLWIKLIQSLCEPEPEALRGHFYSLAGLFRCSKCGEYFTNTIKSFIACQPNNTRLTRWGQLSSHHIHDSLWNMNNFISQIFKELRSWRRVYWKLWGHCHFLYCCICETHFPVYKMAWCRFHPLSPNYLESATDDFIPGPIGRYPCCGQKAFRFQTIPEANGCHFREHSVLAESDRERQILQIMQVVSDDCVIYDPPDESLLTADIIPFWTGISLTPQQCRQGLLLTLNAEHSTKAIRQVGKDGVSYIDDCCSNSSSSDSTDNIDRQGRKNNKFFSEIDSSSDGCESEKPALEALHTKKLKKKPSINSGRNWYGDLSARSNQDHQREYEERALKQIALQMNKSYGLEEGIIPAGPIGGFYVRLETEWKEQLKHRNSSNPTSTPSASFIGKHKNKYQS